MSRFVFDIGGTNMRMALTERDVLGVVRSVPTPMNPQDAVAQLKGFASGTHIKDAVGGVAGIITNGTVTDSPNLRSWEGFSLGTALEEALGVSVAVYNDAELAGIGEATRGAGQGYVRVGYLTIGTGVGGILVVKDGTVLRCEGSEPGRIPLDNGQTLEHLVGGASLTSELGMLPERLSQAVYDERTPLLAKGIRTLIELWSPDVFILNGPLIYGTPAFRIDALCEELVRDMTSQIPLVPAQFKDQSGLWGAVLV